MAAFVITRLKMHIGHIQPIDLSSTWDYHPVRLLCEDRAFDLSDASVYLPPIQRNHSQFTTLSCTDFPFTTVILRSLNISLIFL